MSSIEEQEGDNNVESLRKVPALSVKRPREKDPVIPKYLSKKIKRNELYKAPTIGELKELKEAETMFHSSLFRLQIEELMTEIKAKSKLNHDHQLWLESLKEVIKDIPQSDEFKLNDLSWFKKGKVKVPLMQFPKFKGYFRFLPPSEITEVGSYVLDTSCAPEPVVDVALKLPKAFWMKSDFLNLNYHRKRALYLAYLAQSLHGHPLIDDIQYNYHDNCHLRPVLLLKPKGYDFLARLLPYPEEDSFKCSRFVPERNNIRKSWFYGEPEDDDQLSPTPVYNSTILMDMLMPRLHHFLNTTITSDSVKNGIILLKVWCMQREIYGNRGFVNGFIFAMLVARLLLQKRISPLMSSYQVFHNTLIALKREDWVVQGITLCEDTSLGQPSVEQFQKSFNVVFVETSGFLNLCFSWSKEFYERLRHEAEIALDILDNAAGDSFALLFMNSVPFFRKFECFFRLNATKLDQCIGHLNLKTVLMDHCNDHLSSMISELFKLLKQGLGKRALLFGHKLNSISSWPLHAAPPNPNTGDFVFGILQNAEYSFNNLEKGPAADSSEAREFRSFWGEKSELRRFKDGSIHEAVLWPADTCQEKRRVLSQIVQYILERHVGVSAENITSFGNEIDVALHMPTVLSTNGPPTFATGEEPFTTLMQSFNSLTNQLRKLDGLPLQITSVQGISPAFRFAEVFPPLSKAHLLNPKLCDVLHDAMILRKDCKKAPEWILPLHVMVQLEGSGKWPNDVDAIQRVKAAFYLKISELLNKQFYICTRPTPEFVDILKDGFVYRLHISCHKEITLLKQVKTSDGTIKIKESKESHELECYTEILPKLSGILYSIHSKHSAFGTACRLAKRWISSQLLYDDIEEIAIELIMAFVFIHPEPYTSPSSPQVALQRFFALLHTHDWETVPLVVNFNNELKKLEIADILSTFTSQRTVLPPMVIVTPVDKSGCLWTKKGPSKMVLDRLILLANVSLGTLEKQLMEPRVSDFRVIFRPPLNPYDVLIHLKCKQIPKLCYSVDGSEWNESSLKPYQKHKDEKMPVIGYDPVQCYLSELRECFSEFALFFYDAFGGTFIAVVWKPDAFEKMPFKVSNLNGRMISGADADGNTNIIPNVEAIIDCFKKLGLGLVEKIEKLVGRWNIV